VLAILLAEDFDSAKRLREYSKIRSRRGEEAEDLGQLSQTSPPPHLGG
jgi:hypothetical protein